MQLPVSFLSGRGRSGQVVQGTASERGNEQQTRRSQVHPLVWAPFEKGLVEHV